jgi:hypothetical protein
MNSASVLGGLIGEINVPSSSRRVKVFRLAEEALSQVVVVTLLKELHTSTTLAASSRHLLFHIGVLARIGNPLRARKHSLHIPRRP